MKIAIIGRAADLGNYVRYVESASLEPVPTLNTGEIAHCHGLLLPGGGDITPAFFGEMNNGSRNIDTELDILQLQAFELAMRCSMPVLGICKGMQIINVGLGGTLVQDMTPASCAIHRYEDGDKYHASVIEKDSCLHTLYGDSVVINSAHHQSVDRLGEGLRAIQWCPEDQCVEALCHDTLPIIGLQWHPERLQKEKTTLSGGPLLSYFAALISASAVRC